MNLIASDYVPAIFGQGERTEMEDDDVCNSQASVVAPAHDFCPYSLYPIVSIHVIVKYLDILEY